MINRYLSFGPVRLILVMLLFIQLPGASRANPLVADLSSNLIAVSTGFSGAELLLYGAKDGDGDVIVVVRGPEETTEVRKKERVAGIWVNQGSQSFIKVPSFYAIAANKKLDEILGSDLRALKEIGIDRIRSLPTGDTDPAQKDYWTALLRNKIRQGLYPEKPGKVQVLGGRLFRTDVTFPSSVPTGDFKVSVYLVRDGSIVSTQTTPLTVSKTGLGAQVYDFAYRYSALYGIVAIFMAVFAGWAAGAIFRRA